VINVNDTTLGLVSAAVPLLIIGFLILRRLPWIFAFFVALLAVGLGYLETTGAVRDFGHKVRVALPEGIVGQHHATETPATETPAEGPAMTPASPPAEPTTTPASPPADQPATTPATPPETQPATPPAAPESTPAPSTTPPADNNQTQPAPSQTPPATTP
jgi:hypothetical protein